MTLKSAAACVKATSRSSTARPQKKDGETVIARQRVGAMTGSAKQCIGGSEVCGRGEELDCFVATLLALTGSQPQCPLWLFFIAASCSGLAVP
jgi:hypothetical protein